MEERLENAEGMEYRGVVLATLMKLKQVCNHPAQFLADGSPLPNRSGKLARLLELTGEIVEAGDRAVRPGPDGRFTRRRGRGPRPRARQAA
jgi:SNF2 family DNA or RNA helicase